MRKYYSLINHHHPVHKRNKQGLANSMGSTYSTENKFESKFYTIEILTKYYEQKLNSLQNQIEQLRFEFKQDINTLKQTNPHNYNLNYSPSSKMFNKQRLRISEQNTRTLLSYCHIKNEDKKIMMKTHYPMPKLQNNNSKNSSENMSCLFDYYNQKQTRIYRHNITSEVHHSSNKKVFKKYSSEHNYRHKKIIGEQSNHHYNKSSIIFQNNNIIQSQQIINNNDNKIRAIKILINSSVIEYKLKCKLVFLCSETKKYITNKLDLINITKGNVNSNKEKIKEMISKHVLTFPSKTAILHLQFMTKENENVIIKQLNNGDNNEIYNQFYELIKKLINSKQTEKNKSLSKFIYVFFFYLYRTIVFRIYYSKFF